MPTDTTRLIPSDELERFTRCTREAWDLSAEGRVEEGYEILDLGLIWAEVPAFNPITGEESPLDPWSAELAALYRQELVRYVTEHPAILTSRGLVQRAQVLREAASRLREVSHSLCADSRRLGQRLEQFSGPIPGRPPEGRVH